MRKPPQADLRNQAKDAGFPRRPLSLPEQELRESILACAVVLMARNGAAMLSIANLADAMDRGVRAIKRFFPSIEDLLEELLDRHLQALAAAIGQTPWSHPERQLRHRAAYHQAAHEPDGRLRPSHILLTRDLHLLAEQKRNALDDRWCTLIEHIAPGPVLADIVALLNAPNTSLAAIEAVVSSCAGQKAQSSHAQPAHDPPAPPPPEPEPCASDTGDDEGEPEPRGWFQSRPSITLPDGSAHTRGPSRHQHAGARARAGP